MNILVVEDDEAIGRLVTQVLTSRGHQVTWTVHAFGLCNKVAARGAGAEAIKPDLVILDNQLSGLSGASALEVLAKDRDASRVRVLLHSNMPADQLEVIARKHPRCSWLAKSGRIMELVRAVESTPFDAPPTSSPEMEV